MRGIGYIVPIKRAFCGWTFKSSAFFAALLALVLSQSLLVAHSAEYGSQNHDHDGEECLIILAASAGEKFLDKPSVSFAPSAITFTIATSEPANDPASTLSLAIPPRGPPAR